MRTRQGRDNNLAHKDAFNPLISKLKKKNPYWDRKSANDRGSTARILWLCGYKWKPCDLYPIKCVLLKGAFVGFSMRIARS